MYKPNKDLLKEIINHLIDGGKFYPGIGFKPIPDALREEYNRILREDFQFNGNSIWNINNLK